MGKYFRYEDKDMNTIIMGLIYRLIKVVNNAYKNNISMLDIEWQRYMPPYQEGIKGGVLIWMLDV